uniref:CBM20 domain-containing protein n=1 Tax=Oryza meridionalis TaxID=40149 RepID=A0A0E0DMJ8_9ORYZ
MGTSGSKGIDGVGGVGGGAAGLGGGEAGDGGGGVGGAASRSWHGGAQLYVSLKMENARITGDLVPHVYGSEPIIGSWDPARALAMERELASMWALSFVVPPDHEVGFDTSTESLELDLEHYVIPTPSAATSEYAANLAANPASLIQTGALWTNDMLLSDGIQSPSSATADFEDHNNCNKAMPEAAGAVAAAAVADRLHGSKEDRKLAIVLVGLPARGKTFTAAKLTRYLRWLGHETRHFNVGKYRRLKHGANQSADFFRDDNPEGIEARNEVAALAMEDMIDWMHGGGQVGIFDATNSTRKRRYMLMKMAEGNCKIIFLETICNDPNIIERNVRLKIQQSPDYADQPDYETGVRDFKERLANYEKVYEPVQEGSYIKMIDMVKGQGGQLQVNNISGYLPGRIVFFLVNSHLTPRPILLTRHGESLHNVRGRVGGDTVLSEDGELYSKKLANFIEKRLKSEKTASIWTSTLQRTILTASPIVGFPKIQWRALDEINSGVCDGMTYEEIKKVMPEEFESRKKDKLRYRYPRGESYLDVIQRLEPVIIELERQRAPVVVISHQAVLRALYAYFADRPLREVPDIEMPLHTIIEIQMGVTGVEEKRYKLMD